MGSTQIVNQTSRPLQMKVGNYRHFTNLTVVDANRSYTVHINYSDTYMEYSLGAVGVGNPIIVNSDECIDNKTIIVKEVDGKYDLKMEPRRQKTSSIPTNTAISSKRFKWKFWEK